MLAEARALALRQAESFNLGWELLRDAFPDLVAHPGPDGAKGPYLQDAQMGGAICCTAAEATLLYLLVQHSAARRVVEIGSYVGWSAAHMALAVKPHGGMVSCVDPFTEHEAVAPARRVHERLIGNLLRCHAWGWVEIIPAPSPAGLALAETPWDVVFVDGEHNSGQPLVDVQAAAAGLRDARSVIAVHDTWMPDVAAACAWLRGEGFVETIFHSFALPARMGLYWREPPRWWGPFLGEVDERVVRI